MVYKKDKWVAAYKKVVEDLKTTTPTAGKPCALATLRYIRDNLIDDLGEDHDAVPDIRESFKELIKAISSAGAEDGFASNASAAAKAAGFKSTTAVEAELSE